MKWREKLTLATRAALEGAQGLRSEQARDNVSRPLAQALQLLVSDRPNLEGVTWALLTAGHYANIVVASEGDAGTSLLERVDAAYSLAVARPDRQRSVQSSDSSIAAFGSMLASRGRPTLRDVQREPFARPEPPASTRRESPETSDPFGDQQPPDPAAFLAEDVSVTPPVKLRAENDVAEEPGTLPRPDPPAVRIDPEVGQPISIAKYHADIARACLETIAALSRQRQTLDRPGQIIAENSILKQVDALACAGPRCADDVVAWFMGLEARNEWSTWAAVLSLGTLAGVDALDATAQLIEAISPEAAASGIAASDALLVCPHPDLGSLLDALAQSPSAVARATSMETRARRGSLSLKDWQHLAAETNPTVLAAAARAARFLDEREVAEAIPTLLRMTQLPSRQVVWPAVRTLLSLGRREPFHELQESGYVATMLSPAQKLEVFALCGGEADLPAIQAIVEASETSAAMLFRVALFGHVGTWSLLLHYLGDEDLQDDAIEALLTLFGPCVGEHELEDAAAWKRSIGKLDLDPRVRHRAGKPWRPSEVVTECKGGAMSRATTALWLDDLAIRTRRPHRIDLARWLPDIDAAITAKASTTSDDPGAIGRWI